MRRKIWFSLLILFVLSFTISSVYAVTMEEIAGIWVCDEIREVNFLGMIKEEQLKEYFYLLAITEDGKCIDYNNSVKQLDYGDVSISGNTVNIQFTEVLDSYEYSYNKLIYPWWDEMSRTDFTYGVYPQVIKASQIDDYYGEWRPYAFEVLGIMCPSEWLPVFNMTNSVTYSIDESGTIIRAVFDQGNSSELQMFQAFDDGKLIMSDGTVYYTVELTEEGLLKTTMPVDEHSDMVLYLEPADASSPGSANSSSESDQNLIPFLPSFTHGHFPDSSVEDIYNNERAKFAYCLYFDYSQVDPDFDQNFADYLLEGSLIVGKTDYYLGWGYFGEKAAVAAVYFPELQKASYLKFTGSGKKVEQQFQQFFTKNYKEYEWIPFADLSNAMIQMMK